MAATKHRKVAIADLTIDPRYQRDLDTARVNRYAARYDEREFGTLEVSQRSDDTMVVIDGQHRVALAGLVNKTEAWCNIHRGLTPEEEAELFVHFQENRKNVNPVEKFKAAVFSGSDPIVVEINNIVQANGFRIGRTRHGQGEQGVIGAVSTLKRIYKRGYLDETLQLIHRVWPNDRRSTDRVILEGMGHVVAQYGDRIHDEEIRRLEARSPAEILRRSAGAVDGWVHPSSRAHGVAREIRSLMGLRGRPRVERKLSTARVRAMKQETAGV